jgi:uncharacterized protein
LKIEATVKEIRALMELAGADGRRDQLCSESRRKSRDTLAGRVPRRLLDPYELLLKAGRIPVVVAIERGACSGCHVRLPTMLESRARRMTAIHRCPHCRRMLYAPELVTPDPGSSGAKASSERATRSGGRPA